MKFKKKEEYVEEVVEDVQEEASEPVPEVDPEEAEWLDVEIMGREFIPDYLTVPKTADMKSFCKPRWVNKQKVDWRTMLGYRLVRDKETGQAITRDDVVLMQAHKEVIANMRKKLDERANEQIRKIDDGEQEVDGLKKPIKTANAKNLKSLEAIKKHFTE